MHRGKRVFGCIIGMALLVLGTGGTAAAQDFPTRPIEIYVGAAAGGAGDLLSQAVSTYGSKYIGQTFVTVIKAGASGTIASQYVASAKPDGYTLHLAGGSETTAVGNFRPLPFHPINDFEPIIRLIRLPIVMNVKVDAPWKTFKDFLADAKANPGKYSYATTGIGGIYHAPMIVLERKTGISLRHVPFKGGAEVTSALLGGHVDIGVCSTDEAASLVEAGMIRQLALFSDTRSPAAPTVPTLRELGYNIYIENMKGLVAPKGTPQPVIRKLHDALRRTTEDPGFKAALAKLKMEPAYLNGEDFGKAERFMYEQIGEALKKK